MACASKTNLVSAKKFSHEHLKCNNKEYTVLEGSAGRKIISNKNEAKQVKNRKQLTLKPTRDGKLWKKYYMYSKQQWPPYRTSPSYKPTQFLPEGLAIRSTQTNKFRRF